MESADGESRLVGSGDGPRHQLTPDSGDGGPSMQESLHPAALFLLMTIISFSGFVLVVPTAMLAQ